MRRNLLCKLLLIAGMAPVICGRAQSSFRFKSHLAKVEKPGFYKIILQPGVVGKCNVGLTDIRILDEKANQVPYILQTDPQEFSENSFTNFPILSIKKEADRQTHIVIENPLNKAISEILLVIKNTEADRSVNISGSDDSKHWFVIKENVRLDNFYPPDNYDRFTQYIHFPSSSYKFFKIIINGKDLLPVNIVKAGVQQDQLRHSKYLDIPTPVFTQKDSSNKTSYAFVQFNDEYLINRLELTFEGAKFYRRTLRITNGVTNTPSWRLEYTASSLTPAVYRLNKKTRQLILEIANEDNPPLKLSSIKAYQVNKSLLAYLDAATKYQLVFGDSSARSPNYDLGFFRDSITNSATEIGIGPVLKNDLVKNLERPAGKNGVLILWVVIGAVLVLLLTFTIRMIKEMKGKENVK